MTDPNETPEPIDAASDQPLDETTPPMELHKKSADSAEIETLDQTTAPIDYEGRDAPNGNQK